MLLSQQSPEEIAAASGRSVHIVRTQIKVVYEKTGVSSRAELQELLSIFRTVGALFESAA